MAITVLHESAVEASGPDSVDPTSSGDRRAQTRLSAEDAAWLRGARLKYGPEVHVIDISTTGILYESTGPVATPQSNLVFELSSTAGTTLMPGRVLRSRSWSDGRVQTACAFKRPLSIETVTAISLNDRPIPASAPAPASPSAPAAARGTFQRVIARFRSGILVRGYTSDFHPSKTHLHLTPEDATGETKKVELSQLKAVFFVREFAGDPARVDSTDFGNTRHGRRVEVVFDDGEVLRGTTMGYRNDGSGFFVQPADSGSNNMRIFVAPGATRRVTIL
jgi:hypothetical protein